MDAKTEDFFAKLMLEDDEDDVVYFAFPHQKKKVKCSMSMLAEISPVFEAMFSTRWCDKNVDDAQCTQLTSVSQDKTIQLDDDVKFDQYSTFMQLMRILYGLRKITLLTVEQATDIFYYANKYQLKDVSDNIQTFLDERMKSGMSNHPLSLTELTESIGFAELYNLKTFKNKLDGVKLAFDAMNPVQFWDLTTKFEMEKLQQQIVDHVKTIEPKQDWPTDLLLAIVRRLREDGKAKDKESEEFKKQREQIKKEFEGLKHCFCKESMKLNCGYCGNSKTMSLTNL